MVLVAILVAFALIGRSSGNQDGCYYEELGDNYICYKKPADYPSEEVINELVKKNGIRMNTNVATIESDEYPDYNNSTHKYLDSDQNCESVISDETPFAIIRNITREISQKLIIVQSNEFRQTIKVVKCSNPRSRCFENVIADSERTSCEQMMVQTTLFAFDEAANNNLKHVSVTVPFYCYCKIN